MYCFDLILKFARVVSYFAYKIEQTILNPNLQAYQTQFNLFFFFWRWNTKLKVWTVKWKNGFVSSSRQNPVHYICLHYRWVNDLVRRSNMTVLIGKKNPCLLPFFFSSFLPSLPLSISFFILFSINSSLFVFPSFPLQISPLFLPFFLLPTIFFRKASYPFHFLGG